MATTLSEAAAEVPAETTFFVQINKMCALADETYEERARLRAYFAEECRIWGQIAEQIEKAEWHISGQMKELAEQISEAQSSQPADQHDLQHQEHSQLGSNWDEKPAQSAALAAPPVEQAAPVVAAHNTSAEAPKADCNWDVWLLLDKASSNTTSEAEQISEAQSSQPADQHNLQHQQHNQLGSKWAPPLCLVCLTQEQGSQDTDLLMKQNTLNPRLFLAVWPVVNRWIREGLKAEADRRGNRSILRRCWLVWEQDVFPYALGFRLGFGGRRDAWHASAASSRRLTKQGVSHCALCQW